MQKKNALGMDPLSWLKGKNKEEKHVDNNPSEPENDNESNTESVIQDENVYEPDNATGKHRDDELNLKDETLEDRVYEPSNVTEAYRKSILGEKAYGYHVKKLHEPTQKDSPATAFVIVYTILLLILGFIVYRDLTKQIDTLHTKLKSIEKQVDAGFINYEETKDVW